VSWPRSASGDRFRQWHPRTWVVCPSIDPLEQERQQPRDDAQQGRHEEKKWVPHRVFGTPTAGVPHLLFRGCGATVENDCRPEAADLLALGGWDAYRPGA